MDLKSQRGKSDNQINIKVINIDPDEIMDINKKDAFIKLFNSFLLQVIIF